MPTRKQQLTIEDLCRQINKLVGTTNSVVERYAHSYEEIGAIRVQLLALEGTLRDYFEESGRRDDRLAERIERLERLEILDRTGNRHSIEAGQIRREVKGEHLNRALRQELAQQIKNLEYCRIKAAKFGVNVPTDLINEIESYEEAIKRIRDELNTKAG